MPAETALAPASLIRAVVRSSVVDKGSSYEVNRVKTLAYFAGVPG